MVQPAGKKQVIDLTVEQFNKLYWEDKLSYRLVAETLKVSTDSVRAWVRRKTDSGEIVLRSKSEAAKLAFREKRIDRSGTNNPNWKHGEGKSVHRCFQYGINRQQYKFLVINQDNKCAICGDEFLSTPHIDHDHSTGKVRGLLCRRCNIGLGKFKDSVIELRSAISYLENSENNGPKRWDSREVKL